MNLRCFCIIRFLTIWNVDILLNNVFYVYIIKPFNILGILPYFTFNIITANMGLCTSCVKGIKRGIARAELEEKGRLLRDDIANVDDQIEATKSDVRIELLTMKLGAGSSPLSKDQALYIVKKLKPLHNRRAQLQRRLTPIQASAEMSERIEIGKQIHTAFIDGMSQSGMNTIAEEDGEVLENTSEIFEDYDKTVASIMKAATAHGNDDESLDMESLRNILIGVDPSFGEALDSIALNDFQRELAIINSPAPPNKKPVSSK